MNNCDPTVTAYLASECPNLRQGFGGPKVANATMSVAGFWDLIRQMAYQEKLNSCKLMLIICLYWGLTGRFDFMRIVCAIMMDKVSSEQNERKGLDFETIIKDESKIREGWRNCAGDCALC